tara:strand:- start:64512 stop:65594 length:1083 start_codon:yes stop_codon:yes gene_type:complete
MTYRQALYFVSSCLSLVKHPERRNEISKLITSGYVDWDLVVKFSSNQVVVPSLYYNLKQAQLLKLLPEGLELYFEEISNSNKQRNKALIEQADHLVNILEKHKIEFMFLKGMAHILEGLYLDIGERMVSDIDFLVTQDQVEKVVELLKEEGYTRLYEEGVQFKSRHYARLIHKDFIGAIEIHWNVLDNEHASKLSPDLLFSNKQKIGNYYIPSYAHQALHNMLNAQINDSSYKTGIILLRHVYDSFLLSFKPEVQSTLKNYKHDYYLKNLYLKLLHKLFKAEVTLYRKSLFLNFLMLRYEFTTNRKLYKLEKRVTYFSFRLYNYPHRFFLILINRKIYKKTIKNITTKGWLKRHLKSYKK